MVICCHAALDGQNKLKLYWIDLIDSARLQLEDLALAGKVYHKYRFSNRIFEKANAGLVLSFFRC